MKAPLTMPLRRYTLLDAVVIPFRCAPGAAFFYAFFDLSNAVIVPLKTLVVARFIDAAIESLRLGTPNNDVYISIGLLALIGAFQWFKQALHNFADLKLHLSLRERYRTALTRKRTRLSYHHVDNDEAWNLIQRVATNPETANLKQAYYHLIDMASFVIKVGGLLAILTTAVWWGSLAVVCISALTLATGIRGGKLQYQAEREASRSDKRTDYYSSVLLGREAGDERTMFGFSPRVASLWRASFLSAMKVRIRTRLKWYISAYLGSFITQATWIFMMVILLNPLRTGVISVGLFIALTQAFTSLNIVWGFMETVHGIAADNEFFSDLTSFVNLEESDDGARTYATRDRAKPVFESLEIKDLSFAYPGSNALVLSGLSCRLNPGTHYALVGANGAGKTTLTRILTGLYPATSGAILLNGIPLHEYSRASLAAHFSLVYQDFCRYQISLKDNILLGADPQELPKGSETLLDALVDTGLDRVIERLPRGLDTPLGKLAADGVDLSGGEWQRVAMARALISSAPFRILDEPTAALDPVAESELYRLFDRISGDATTLFISHRLGATKIANEILVLQDGTIAESGSHDELMSHDGLYREMFESQRSWYELDI